MKVLGPILLSEITEVGCLQTMEMLTLWNRKISVSLEVCHDLMHQMLQKVKRDSFYQKPSLPDFLTLSTNKVVASSVERLER